MESKRKLMVDIEKLNKTFVARNKTQNEINVVINQLDLKVYENEFIVLFGPGQCGKTTILNIIAGLEKKTSGSVIVNGNQVDGPATDRGMVYQSTSLFPWETVMGNVSFGPRMAGKKKSEWLPKAQQYIDMVDLTGFENTYPIKLSGGMQQRVGIARVYCNNPDIILMDEPFGHLDAQTRYMMERDISNFCNSEKRTVIFVTNNVEEAIYLADRIVLLKDTPTKIVKEYIVDLPKPRNYTSKDFLNLREKITQDVENLTGGEADER